MRCMASASRFLEAGAPTGLTGLLTHSAPRPTLVHLYNQTLERLKLFPESSVYRQSTEALTKQRLSVVDSVRPAGYEDWVARVDKMKAENPSLVTGAATASSQGSVPGGFMEVNYRRDDANSDWGGEKPVMGKEGPRSAADRADLLELTKKPPGPRIKWEQEPPLDAEQ
jgi:ETC complex I subunit conserved region